MWSMKDMFYGEAEPVWILKPEKEDSKKAEKKSDSGSTGSSSSSSKKEAERAADYYLSSIPYYPYDYPDSVPPPTPRKEESKIATHPKKDTKVVLKVPICCGECVESIEAALYGLRGVESVECDTRTERVIVVATTAAPAEILVECRKVFRKSRFWTDDDY